MSDQYDLDKYADEVQFEVEKEARFMAEKYGCTETLAQILIYHGIGMGLEQAKGVLK